MEQAELSCDEAGRFCPCCCLWMLKYFHLRAAGVEGWASEYNARFIGGWSAELGLFFFACLEHDCLKYDRMAYLKPRVTSFIQK